jgi:hypothetical protein
MRNLIASLLVSVALLGGTAKAQVNEFTESIIGTASASSYDTVGDFSNIGYAAVVMGYLHAGIDLMNPEHTNLLGSISRSGANGWLWLTNSLPQAAPPYWALAVTNGVTPRHFHLVDDNGSYQSNQVYSFGSQLLAAPGSIWNNTAFTNEGFGFTVDFEILGANVSGSGASDTSAISRNDGANRLMLDQGKTPIDLWHGAYTNGMNFVTLTVAGDWYNSGGHLTYKTALQHFIASWKGLNWPTNVGSIAFDYAATNVVSSNRIAASGMAMTNGTFSFRFKCDRLTPPWDLLPAISNQVAQTLWTNCPAFGMAFRHIFAFSNLSATTIYKLYISDVLVRSGTGAEWMAGYNMATNDVILNPLNVQRMNVLYDIRLMYGSNPTNGLALHGAGENGTLGADFINYGSHRFGEWPGVHGPALVVSAWSDITSIWTNYAGKAFVDSQPVEYFAQLVPVLPPKHMRIR